MKTTKRILVLLCLMVVTMGAWADGFVPYLTIEEDGVSSETNMTPLEVTGANPDARATYTVDLEAGTHTFKIYGYYLVNEVATKTTNTNPITFTLSEPQTITFYATHPKGANYVQVVCNAIYYAIGNAQWRLYTRLKPTFGETSEAYFVTTGTSYNRFDLLKSLQESTTTYLVAPGNSRNPTTLTQGTAPTANRINKAELNYLTGVINYTAVEDVPVTISAAGASTLLLPVAATIPSGVKAYTLKYDGSDQLVATEVTGTIPANTPVLLNAAPGTYNFHVGTNTSTCVEVTGNYIPDVTTSDNDLIGVLMPHYVPENSYVLQYNKVNEEWKVGFYKVTGDGSATYIIDQFRCYLTLPAADPEAHALTIVYPDDETTGIADVRGKMGDERSDIFNLSGQRVGKDYKGVVIKNGRKMIQK